MSVSWVRLQERARASAAAATDSLAFTGEAGSGVAFRSALWHRTERAGAGVWKLAVFYGYLL